MFRKPEEKIETANYDELEQSGYSGTKSSPDDTSSDLVQEIASPDTQLGNDSEGIKNWLTYRAEKTTQNNVMPVDSCSNSRATSDTEDHRAEAVATEVRVEFFLI